MGFAAWSGAGKTTLLKKVLALMAERGLRVAVIKHAHHRFDIDHPGKDSYELRQAGAMQMLVASARREALIIEKPQPQEPDLDRLICRLDQDNVDLILVEGFRQAGIPKIEVYREAVGKTALYPLDKHIVAVATDAALPVPTDLPVLDINDPDSVASFICDRTGIGRGERREGG